MVAEIFEDFEPPSKKFLATPLFYQIFFSSQVKRCAIITYKHSIYKLPLELPNEISGKRLNFI